jgi:hypothetical protein
VNAADTNPTSTLEPPNVVMKHGQHGERSTKVLPG